jgi:predicted branched-subunit amino acid permease
MPGVYQTGFARIAVLSPRSEFLAGVRDIAPVLLGTVPFGLVAGVAAVSAGLSALEGLALSALRVLRHRAAHHMPAASPPDSPVIVTVGAAFVVSLRLLMYSAALSPHLAHLNRAGARCSPSS